MDNLEKLRKELWETTYLTPLRPNDLLENTKDPDYLNISFSREAESLKGELFFKDEEKIIKAEYYFDCNDHLVIAKIIEENDEIVIYDREQRKADIISTIMKNYGVKELNSFVS
ncbi:hypothetical protein ACH0CI_25880 [Priestia sp. 179-F W1.4 NHS]|uniref:hypothetical protein n=1 Tax=Priestia sp. 179-F W1.4 NHS TaxID=3374296 RepID=UPI0013F4AB1B|nr:hypothetical protein [Priestia megaterium]NGY89641.1 hypothetical protein [Priestia megaterium]